MALPRALAIVAFALTLGAGPARGQDAAAASGAAEVVEVRTQAFERLALRPQREAPAAVVPRNEARLAAEVAGRVRRWTVDTGGTTRAGELLVELDPTDYRLARDQARAALDASTARLRLAESQLGRARELVAQGFFSQEALNARETEVQLMRTEQVANRAQLAAAERALAKTRIVAPFTGSVKQRLAQNGEYVTPGAPLYVLTQTDDAEVSAHVMLQDADSVRRSAALEFVGAGTRVPLRVLRIASTVTASARTVEVRLQPIDQAAPGGAQPAAGPNEGAAGDRARPALIVGSEGQLVWRAGQPHVPAGVVVRRDDRLGIFVVEDGKARFVPLPDAQEGRAAAVSLPPEKQVVVGGQAALRDGQPVKPAAH